MCIIPWKLLVPTASAVFSFDIFHRRAVQYTKPLIKKRTEEKSDERNKSDKQSSGAYNNVSLFSAVAAHFIYNSAAPFNP